MAQKQDSGLDFNADLQSSQASTFCHELSMGIMQQRHTVSPDDFFQVDILTSEIITPSQQKESGYNTRTFQLSKQEDFVPYKDHFEKSVIFEFEEKLKKTDMQAAAIDFIRNPDDKNIFYPKFEYFEEKLIKEENIEDFRQYIRDALRYELESSDRDKIVNRSTPDNIKTEMKVGKAYDSNKREPERCSSPDMFEEYEEDEITCKKAKSGSHSSPRYDLPAAQNFDNDMPMSSDAIQNYTEHLIDGFQEDVEQLPERRKELISKIEDLIKTLLESLVNGRPIELHIRNTNKWANCNLVDEALTLKPSGSSTEKRISFTDGRTKSKFAIIMYLLSEIYHLLVTGSTCTLRELYYRDPELVETHINVSLAIKDICCLLDAAPWELGVLSSSKGLIAGPIRITLANDDVIDCFNYPRGVLIPQDTSGIKLLESTAKLVLLVEKHTVYENLLQRNILKIMGGDILLMTGKGYPDVNTRVMLKKIWDLLRLPVYVLVDADPFGIEILMVYRYGSRAMSYNSDNLACPHIRWIGIHPSEIELLAIPSVPLNNEDKKRLSDLLQRSYLKDEIRDELHILQRINQKAEIEGVLTFSWNFLTVDYLPSKIKRSFAV